MTEMSILRKEDLSLFSYIKDTVLINFRETEESVTLKKLSSLCGNGSYVYEAVIDDLYPAPTSIGRGWVYFDLPSGGSFCEPYTSVSGLNGDGDPAFGTPEQSNEIIVYENSSVEVDWLDYMIDYTDGRVISTRNLISPKVTYSWNYVSVVNDWSKIEASSPPIVVLNINNSAKKGYQLGAGKLVKRSCEIYVFATNNAERSDLTEVIYDGLHNRSCPLYDFPTGSVLDYDGTFYGRRDLIDRVSSPENKLTYLFDRSKVLNVNKLQFESVEARNINQPITATRAGNTSMLSDINAYRSVIRFDIISYDDRIV